MIPGIYIHIPFCLSKCGYCDFYSVTEAGKIPLFTTSLIREMEMYRGVFDRFDTIYLGGGTPSLLGADQTGQLLDALHRTFLFFDDTEVTIEANPGDLSPEMASSLYTAGIGRISIGVQSFDDGTLALLGRRHSATEAITAIENARRAGFGNVGLDLIYGVPGQNIRSWLETIHTALSFAPEHLSCYQLTLEPSTPLGLRYRSGEIVPPDDALLCEFFMKTSETLEAAGYVHYEVSNFARGDEWMSRHNRKYWDHTPYLGLGPAAHSFSGNRRWWNHRCLDRYIEEVGRKVSPIGGSEMLTGEQLRLESLYLGLRTKRGVDLDEFAHRYGCDLLHEKGELLRTMQREDLITITGNHLRPTRAGLLLSDSLPLL
ncbi:MAG: radical SAM family heme chaperone HemW [Syntrophales bacterium]|nr:radical SAM family heme chaperone HemW [Syntrophales bacterium]